MIDLGDIKIIPAVIPAGQTFEYEVVETPKEGDLPPQETLRYWNGSFVSLDLAKRAGLYLRKTKRTTLSVGSVQYTYTNRNGESYTDEPYEGVYAAIDPYGDPYFPLDVKITQTFPKDTVSVCLIGEGYKYFMYQPIPEGFEIESGRAYIVKGSVTINGKYITEKNVISISQPTQIYSSDEAVVVLFRK